MRFPFRRPKSPSPPQLIREDARREAIFLLRHDRESEKSWQATYSCFGGIPDIPSDRWPRSRRQKMPCLLRIDLQELAAIAPLPNGRTFGTLLYFGVMDAYEHIPRIAIRYVDTRVREAKAIPDGLSRLNAGFDAPMGYQNNQASPVPLRRWPIRFVRVTENLAGEVVADGPSPQPTLQMVDLSALAEGEALAPFPARAAQFLLDETARTLSKSYAESHPTLQHPATTSAAEAAAALRNWRRSLDEADPVLRFLDRWSDPVGNADPWAPLGPEIGIPMCREFETLISDRPTARWLNLMFNNMSMEGRAMTHRAALLAYRLMFTGTAEHFARVPEAVRKALRAQPTSGSLLGFGRSLQDETEQRKEDALLLETSHDLLSGIAFGNGAKLHLWQSWDAFCAASEQETTVTFNAD